VVKVVSLIPRLSSLQSDTLLQIWARQTNGGNQNLEQLHE